MHFHLCAGYKLRRGEGRGSDQQTQTYASGEAQKVLELFLSAEFFSRCASCTTFVQMRFLLRKTNFAVACDSFKNVFQKQTLLYIFFLFKTRPNIFFKLELVSKVSNGHSSTICYSLITRTNLARQVTFFSKTAFGECSGFGEYHKCQIFW